MHTKLSFVSNRPLPTGNDLAKAELDYVLWSQHDADPEIWFRENPGITYVSEEARKYVMRLCAVERDNGASEITHALAQYIQNHTREKVLIAIVENRVPRPLCDTNRNKHIPEGYESAHQTDQIIWPGILQYFSNQDRMERLLMEAYDHSTEIQEKMISLLKESMGFADIHTMRAHEIKPRPDPCDIPKYIDTLATAHIREYPLRNENLFEISCPHTLIELGKYFPYGKPDTPYHLSPLHRVSRLVQRLKGCHFVIDIPRHLFSSVLKDSDLTPILHREKIEEIAAKLGRAMLAVRQGASMPLP